MATRKTGTVTGANLEKATKGKKGGLTGSKRVTGEFSTPPSTVVSTPSDTQSEQSTAIPTPSSVVATLQGIANGAASAIEKGANTVNAVQGYVSRVTESIKGTDNDRNPSAVTNGQIDAADILTRASAEIDENIPQMDSGEAVKRNTIIARQRNFVGVAINNTRLKQDIATLDIEQKRLIGLLIDGKTLEVNNETKAVGFHRAVVARDTELSRLDQDREREHPNFAKIKEQKIFAMNNCE